MKTDLQSSSFTKHQSRRWTINHDFLMLWIGQGISQFGDAILEVTLPIWVGMMTNSPLQVALVAGMELLPSILLGPMAGAIADRLNPKLMMVWADLLRAFLVLLLLIVRGNESLYVVYPVCFLLSLGARLSTSSQSVLLRWIVSDADTARAQALMRVASSIALAIGPVVGSSLLYGFGADIGFVIDSVTFLASMFVVLCVRFTMQPEPLTSGLMPGKRYTELLVDVREGIGITLKSRRLSTLLVVTGVSSAIGTLWFSVDTFFVQRTLGLPKAAIGPLWAMSAVGDILAGIILMMYSNRMKPISLVVLGIVIRGGAIVGYSLSSDYSFALCATCLSGFGGGLLSVAIGTGMVKWTARGTMGRVSSVFDTGAQVSSMFGIIAVGCISPALSPKNTLLSCGVLLLMAGAFTVWRMSRTLK